jgi:hypothetical protein
MARTKLGSMSVDALLTLRDDVERALSGRAEELQHQLSMLGRELGPKTRVRGSSLKGSEGPYQIPRQLRQHLGRTRSETRLA